MKTKKRMLFLLLTGVLCLTIACAALAEGRLLTIWKAGSSLLFETDNVTLSGHAMFTYDGEEFKSFSGSYIQDGSNSYMQAMFDTPKEDGTTYTGGYTVIAENGTAYSIETNTPRFYRQSSTSQAESILTNTVIRSSLMRFGGLLLDLMEDRMTDAITQRVTEEGTEYTICLHDGQAPEAADAALTLAIQLIGKEYFSIDPQDFVQESRMSTGVKVYVENWEALFNHEYEKAYGESKPEKFYAMIWDETAESKAMNERYVAISNIINDMERKYRSEYETGVVSIGPDGSAKHYATRDEYIIAIGDQMVYYENSDETFSHYYEKQTGTPISHAEMKQIWASNNHELVDSFVLMHEQMRQEYLDIAQENKVSCIIVHADGSYTLHNDYNSLNRIAQLGYMTPTRRILYSLESADIDTVDMVVELDPQGRLRLVTGTVEIMTHDQLGATHELQVTFTGTADQYGESSVAPFDPEEYNVISVQEYYANADALSINDVDQPSDMPAGPETIVFNGVEYQLRVENDEGNG